MNTTNEVLTITNFMIVLFGFATIVWMGEISNYFAVKYPRLVMVGLLPVFVFTIATAEYVLLTYIDLLPSGFSTFVFAIDNALGMILVASLCLIGAFYLLFPFLKLGRDFLPRQVAKEISIFKSPPLNGPGAIYINISFVIISLVAVLILPSINQFLYGTCKEPYTALCTRFSVFTARSANYLSVNVSLNEIIAQLLVVTGALTAILGVIKAIIEIYKGLRDNKKDNGMKEQSQIGEASELK